MPDSPLRGRRIVIAEDDCFLADELDLALRRAGAEMLGPVASLQDGLRLLTAAPVVDAASLDVNLKGESVYPLADVLMGGAVPFVFTTGYDRSVIPDAYVRFRRLEKLIEPGTA